MWVQIFCGLVIYKIFRRFISGDDTNFSDVDSKDSDIAFAVANRMERIYGGRAFVGLRIPARENGSRHHIDVVVVAKREVIVVAIRSFTGFLERDKEENWVSIKDKKHKPEIHSDPVHANLGSNTNQRNIVSSLRRVASDKPTATSLPKRTEFCFKRVAGVNHVTLASTMRASRTKFF